MGCSQQKFDNRKKTQAVLNDKALTAARLAWCCTASECSWPCERMVKAPGKAVYCVDVKAATQADLRLMIENREAKCPAGVW